MSTHNAQPLRGWLPWNSPQSSRLKPPPPAVCERCGCKLSGYRDAWEVHCATCSQVLVAEGQLVVAPFEPEWASSAETARATVTHPTGQPRGPGRPRKYASDDARHYDTCHCGNKKKKVSSQCKGCYARRGAGTYNSRICECGARKSQHSRTCQACYQRRRWGIAA